MYTLEDRLIGLNLKQLNKIYNSNKEYIFVDISVFNVGAKIDIVCTNNYDKYSKKIESWNNEGYDILLENSYELHYTLEGMIIKKFHSLCKEWAKNCYYYTFEEFLKLHKLNESYYRKLLSFYNKNYNKYKLD